MEILSQDDIKIYAANAGFMRGIELAGVMRNPMTNKQHLLVPAVIDDNPHTEGTILKPFIRLEHESAQKLIDSLWHCGLRPTDLQDQSGELKATKYHLEDFRKLYFKFIE